MDRNLFLPHNWEDLKWWVNTAKRLLNDIVGGRSCVAQSVVIKVERHLGGRTSQPFELPLLVGYLQISAPRGTRFDRVCHSSEEQGIYKVVEGQEETLKGGAWCLHTPLGFDGRKWQIICVR
jgi:hypothetical protein